MSIFKQMSEGANKSGDNQMTGVKQGKKLECRRERDKRAHLGNISRSRHDEDESGLVKSIGSDERKREVGEGGGEGCDDSKRGSVENGSFQ